MFTISRGFVRDRTDNFRQKIKTYKIGKPKQNNFSNRIWVEFNEMYKLKQLHAVCFLGIHNLLCNITCKPFITIFLQCFYKGDKINKNISTVDHWTCKNKYTEKILKQI